MTRTFQALGIGIALLGLNLWGVAPLLTRFAGEMPANVTYLILRISIFFLLGASLTVWAGRKRVQAISLVSLAAFFDQVIWKGLWIGRELPWGTLVVNLMMSYALFLPLVVVLSFVGAEAGEAAARRWKWKLG